MIVFVDLLGLTILIPLLPLYAATFGANEFVIGLLAAVYPLLQFVAAPLLGQLSDKYGRRPVLIVSQIGTLIGFLILGFAGTLWMLFLSRTIDGISGANIVTAQAVITDKTSEKTRTHGLGLIGAAFGVGFTVGPLIAFIVLALSNNNYHLVAFVAAGCSLASILLTWFWLDESLPLEERGQGKDRVVGLGTMLAALSRPEVGFLMTLMFIQRFAFSGFEQFFPVFTLSRLGLNGSGNAALFVFIGIILVIVQGGLIGRWSRRFGDRWLVLMGLSILGVGLIMSALTPHQPVPWYSKADLTVSLTQGKESYGPMETNAQIDLPDDDYTGWTGFTWLLVALIPASIGGGILQPSLNSLMTQRAKTSQAGNILGASAAFVSLAHVISPLAFGAIFLLFGSTAPFFIGGIILLSLWGVAKQKLI